MAKVLHFDRWIPVEDLKKKPDVRSNGRKILCVGQDDPILKMRCEVLSAEGYDAESCLVTEAARKLRTNSIDLIILSTDVGAADMQLIRSLVTSGTQMLALDDMIMPEELLSAVQLILG
jgi:CheY-like chemotaxis protein